MRDELFELSFPHRFQILVVDVLNFPHKTVDILYQDVIASDQDALLFLLALLISLWKRYTFIVSYRLTDYLLLPAQSVCICRLIQG